MIHFNIKSLVRTNILKLKPYSSARDEFEDFDTTEAVFLDANENPFNNGLNRYPDPQQKVLKKILAEHKYLNTEQIFLGNGSDEVLDLIFRAFCNPEKDNIITLPPTYGMYGVLSNINNVENREVLLDPNFQPDLEKIFEAIDHNTKIIFLCSPNNPTGNMIDDEKVKHILENFNGIVVIDEAYIDFCEKESWASKLGEYPNLISVQTLSKAYGLAGIRLGICYASATIISILNKIKPPYNINELTQTKAIERLEDIAEIREQVSEIISQREKLINEFAGINFVEKVYPTAANFILIKVDDAVERYDALVTKGVVVRNRTTQPLCKNCLRITVGTEIENRKLIEEMRKL